MKSKKLVQHVYCRSERAALLCQTLRGWYSRVTLAAAVLARAPLALMHRAHLVSFFSSRRRVGRPVRAVASRTPKVRRHVVQGEAIAHLPPDAELLGDDDLCDGRPGDDEPEKDRGRERGRVVDGEDQVDKDEGERKVEDVRRPTDDVIQRKDAAGGNAQIVRFSDISGQ